MMTAEDYGEIADLVGACTLTIRRAGEVVTVYFDPLQFEAALRHRAASAIVGVASVMIPEGSS